MATDCTNETVPVMSQKMLYQLLRRLELARFRDRHTMFSVEKKLNKSQGLFTMVFFFWFVG
jgi:hypothetical protein